jgi:threonyl-tRNA synthetase
MEYVDVDGQKKCPYVIHRSSIGCYERTLAMLLEKHAGALPMWLMPEQVRVLPINENMHEDAKKLEQSLRMAGIPRITTDTRNEKIGYKIRSAQMSKIPYMIVLGAKEIESGTISVRSRSEGDLGSMTPDEFVKLALDEISSKK